MMKAVRRRIITFVIMKRSNDFSQLNITKIEHSRLKNLGVYINKTREYSNYVYCTISLSITQPHKHTHAKVKKREKISGNIKIKGKKCFNCYVNHITGKLSRNAKL